MVSRRTRVAFWIFRRDHPSRPNAMICCFFSSFKTFAILREATYPPAAVNVLDVSSESMAAFQVFMYGRFWVFTEEVDFDLVEPTGVDGGVHQDGIGPLRANALYGFLAAMSRAVVHDPKDAVGRLVRLLGHDLSHEANR